MNGCKFLLGLGISLLWLGFAPSNSSFAPASAIYSLDGQSSIPFIVPGVSAADLDASLYNQVFFQTGTLSRGQHELIVTYQGNNGTAPLALDAFIVQNATSSTATSALTSAPGTSSSDSWGIPSNSTSNLGLNPTIVGIIAGVVSVVLVLALFLLLYIVRCRRKAQKLKRLEPFIMSPQNYIPPSFSSKFSRNRELADAPDTSIPTPPPVIGARANPAIRNPETKQLLPSTSAQDGDLGFLQHADSGVRMPNAQGNLAEFPPAYTRR